MRNLLFIALAAMTLSFTSVEESSGFCDGWEEGYQAALDDCLKVGLTPLCPLEPINSQGYKTGYGRGYAAAQRKHCD